MATSVISKNGKGIHCVHVTIPNGSDVVFTFPNMAAFMIQVYRANSTSGGNMGLYVGQVHSASVIKPVLESSVITTMSISGYNLTMQANANNINAAIIIFD